MFRFGWEDDFHNDSLSTWQKLKPRIWRLFDEPSSSQGAKVMPHPFLLLCILTSPCTSLSSIFPSHSHPPHSFCSLSSSFSYLSISPYLLCFPPISFSSSPTSPLLFLLSPLILLNSPSCFFFSSVHSTSC
uniref:Uncharacterized protein n=1 Tax=Ascaris lumbricoides TaxID=6252 RepID=A0A0M3IWM3_ASCLU